MIRVKGDFMQINVVTVVGDLQESCMSVSTSPWKPTLETTNGSLCYHC